jgi:hypothetical protein
MLQLQNVSTKTYGYKSSVLRRKVVNFARCGVVLSREFEKGRDAYMKQMASILVKMASSLLYTDQSRNQSRG